VNLGRDGTMSRSQGTRKRAQRRLCVGLGVTLLRMGGCGFVTLGHTSSTVENPSGAGSHIQEMCPARRVPIQRSVVPIPRVVGKVRHLGAKRYSKCGAPSPVRRSRSCNYKRTPYRESIEKAAVSKAEYGVRNFSPRIGFHNRGQQTPSSASGCTRFNIQRIQEDRRAQTYEAPEEI
jgi:hypothetical protein